MTTSTTETRLSRVETAVGNLEGWMEEISKDIKHLARPNWGLIVAAIAVCITVVVTAIGGAATIIKANQVGTIKPIERDIVYLQKSIVQQGNALQIKLSDALINWQREAMEQREWDLQQKEILLEHTRRLAVVEERSLWLKESVIEGFGLAPRNTSLTTLEYMLQQRENELRTLKQQKEN